MVHAQLHHRVDGLGRADAVVQAIDRLVDHRQQDAVGDESRIVARLGGRFAEAQRQVPGDLEGLVGGRQAADHLHQLHHRHRVHEVHPDDLVRAFGPSGDAADGNRGGVGGQDGLRAAEGVQVPEELELDLLVFRGRLHHEVGRREVLQVGAGPDAAEDGVLVRRRQFALFHLATEVLFDGGHAPLNELVLDVVHDHVQAAGGGHLGDPVAHLPGADDAEGIDLHDSSFGEMKINRSYRTYRTYIFVGRPV